MNTTLKNSLLFITGAAIASFITYKVVEKKFKDIADEEIESVKAMYERKLAKKESEHKEEAVEAPSNGTSVPEIDSGSYGSIVSDFGYKNNEEGEKKVDDEVNIEIIPPEDFGEYGYKCESLTYYADKVLTFDNDKKVNNVKKYVGLDALNTFGEYEDDSVFVRNHDMKTDFEILLDSRRYSDVVESTTDDDE